MFKRLVGLLTVTVVGLFLSGVASAAGIAGSAHDFTDGLNADGSAGGDTWSSTTGVGGQICVTCHAPHNNTGGGIGELLWNRAVFATSFEAYTSPTLDGGSSVGASSLLCLSCHDGTVALDSYGGSTSLDVTMMGGVDANLVVGQPGATLAQDHPVGVDYDLALTTGDDPTLAALTKLVDVGEGANAKNDELQALLLVGGFVECGSCHDPHNTLGYAATDNKLLKISEVGSEICLACHEK